jgi:hypothetical protein
MQMAVKWIRKIAVEAGREGSMREWALGFEG